MTQKQSIFRVKLLGGFFAILLIIIGYRLYQVQIVNGQEFKHQAGSQYVQTSATNFDRGNIYVKNNVGTKFPVANVSSGYLLAIHPPILAETGVSADKLAAEIWSAMTPAEQLEYGDDFVSDFKAKANKVDDPYEEITTKLSSDTADRIMALDYKGVNVYGERWRNYPADEMLSHVIGFTSFTGTNDDERVGTYGLERQYQEELSRTNSSIFTNFFAEAFSTAKEVVSDQMSSDLYLTIDRSVQIELEKTLQDTRDIWSTKDTAGIVMDPKTGAIIAMAATPAFDVNHFNQVDSSDHYINPLIENVYEMGSIMKALTMAYALDSGSVTQNTTYNDTGRLTIDKSTISNYDGRARGVVPIQEILNQSLNTGTAFLMTQTGSKKFKEYFIKSGLDKVTGIDLPNEAAPLTQSLLTSPRQIEYVTASFGQGFAVSPVAMTRALAVLANGGELPNPYIVERIQHELGTWSDNRNTKTTRVISKETADETTEMLVKVVDEALAGGNKSLENYSIAAKTGTAQIANQTGQYRDDAYLHTFFGYFPAYEPKYLIFLMNVEPVGARYASETLTDPFMSLTKFLINYQNLEPDR